MTNAISLLKHLKDNKSIIKGHAFPGRLLHLVYVYLTLVPVKSQLKLCIPNYVHVQRILYHLQKNLFTTSNPTLDLEYYLQLSVYEYKSLCGYYLSQIFCFMVCIVMISANAMASCRAFINA